MRGVGALHSGTRHLKYSRMLLLLFLLLYFLSFAFVALRFISFSSFFFLYFVEVHSKTHFSLDPRERERGGGGHSARARERKERKLRCTQSAFDPGVAVDVAAGN